jgi:hypothetical protein
MQQLITKVQFDRKAGFYRVTLACGHSKLRISGRRTKRPSEWAVKRLGVRSNCEECETYPIGTLERRRSYKQRYRAKRTNRPWIPQVQKRLSTDRYRRNNPEKAFAHAVVTAAVRYGVIKKPKGCSKCGATYRVEGHHEDYSKPLDVIWLCTRCYREHHDKLKMAV